MPTVLLPVPHFEQSQDGMCLPACTRMIFSYWGQTYTEAELARRLDTKSFGTAITNVVRLRQAGYQVDFAPLTPDQLKAHIQAGKPVVVRLWTAMLDYWKIDTSHVAVVVGFDDTFVYLNDPAFAQWPQRVLWDGFLAAWAEFDETSAVIYPARQ